MGHRGRYSFGAVRCLYSKISAKFVPRYLHPHWIRRRVVGISGRDVPYCVHVFTTTNAFAGGMLVVFSGLRICVSLNRRFVGRPSEESVTSVTSIGSFSLEPPEGLSLLPNCPGCVPFVTAPQSPPGLIFLLWHVQFFILWGVFSRGRFYT